MGQKPVAPPRVLGAEDADPGHDRDSNLEENPEHRVTPGPGPEREQGWYE